MKLGDFGISRFLPISLSKDIQLDTMAAAVSAETFVGTLTYMSPERINSENYGYLNLISNVKSKTATKVTTKIISTADIADEVIADSICCN